MSQPVEIRTSAPRSEPSSAPASQGHGGCGCGGHAPAAEPVLDVRLIPHALRHGAVLGAFGTLTSGASMVLVAPHAPRPLLKQLAEQGPVDVEYLVEGPEEWHLRLTRPAAAV